MLPFSLDENVSEDWIAALRAVGHDTVSPTQLGTKGASDVRQLVLATRMSRILITHNFRHFEVLHEAWHVLAAEWNVPSPSRHPGILVVPNAGIAPFDDAVRAVDHAVTELGPLANRLLVWKPRTGWREVSV